MLCPAAIFAVCTENLFLVSSVLAVSRASRSSAVPGSAEAEKLKNLNH
jgi:hypothetical protein